MGAVLWSSAVMLADICDKCTDHKLSNHSRTCLLAAAVVRLCTLSPLSRARFSPSALCTAAVLDTFGLSSLWWQLKRVIVAKGISSQCKSPLNISSPHSPWPLLGSTSGTFLGHKQLYGGKYCAWLTTADGTIFIPNLFPFSSAADELSLSQTLLSF